MQEPKLDGTGSLANPLEHVTTPEAEHIDPDGENRADVVATVATVAVVGIVAAACRDVGTATFSKNGRGIEPAVQDHGSQRL